MLSHIVCTSTRWQGELPLGIISVSTYLWNVRMQRAIDQHTNQRTYINLFILKHLKFT